MEETIIEVDETHRIKITKQWLSEDCWGWEVLKQKLFTAVFSFKKKWYSNPWTNDSSLTFTVKSYYNKNDAIRKAEEIKREFLSNK